MVGSDPTQAPCFSYGLPIHHSTGGLIYFFAQAGLDYLYHYLFMGNKASINPLTARIYS